MRRFLHSSIRVIFLLTIGALIWTGWYASTHGFSRKWRERVTKELRKLGAQVYVHRLTLDPLRGLVAREVVISDPRNPQTHFATINRVVLDINYSNLLHGEPFLNAVDLHDAEVTLPLDPADPASERVNISRLSARLLLSADELYLSQAEAQIAGMQISAHGRLQNPRAFKPSPTAAPGGGAGRSAFETLLKELRSTHFEGGPPQIEIEFGGDIAEPRTLFADATLWGEKVRRGSYVIENCFASLSYRDRACELKRCSLSDAHGAFDASGSYDFVSAKATLRVRSTIDLQALTHSLRVPHLLDEFVFYDPPLLEFSAEGVLGKESQIKLLGRVELGKFAFKSALFEEAATSFSYDGSRWYLRGSHLRDRTGKITANALQESGNFRAQLSSSINPRSLLPLLSGKPAQLLGEWDFAQSPQIELAVSGASPDIAQCEAQGEIKLGRTRMRGVPLKSASAIMRVKDNVVSYENFRVDRDEGSGTGTFRYDFGRHEAVLENVKTRLNTADAATWIGFGLPHDLAPYRFHAAPGVVLNGHIGHDNTHLDVLVDAPGGMDYFFLKKTLSFPRISGHLLFTEGLLRISDLAGTLYGGGLRGSAEISLKRNAPGYSAKIEAENVDFASLTKLYFNYDNSQGLLRGTFDFRGRNDDARTLQGTGRISVVNGDVFAIPVLGPFSGILNTIVPNMGYNIARDASCSFDVRDGVIATDDFAVKGTGFEMLGGGKLFFLDDKIDFTIRLNAQGVPGVLLFPVSKLFEYVSDGSLSKPAWRPKRLPSL